jgi:uncharacterized protein (TIGR03083 family)
MDVTSLGPATYLEAITANAAALVDAATVAGLDAPVPSCPGWAVADLLEHIGRVHRWVVANTTRDPDAGFWSSREIDSPDAAGRGEWVRDGAIELVAALDHDPQTPCWTFVPPPVLAFWQRRQAHETAMHRVDAQLAAGHVEPIAPELAADGIDELLWLLPMVPWSKPEGGTGATAHLHCTDVEGEWFLEFAPEGLRVERVHAKADVAVRGAASDLLRWCSGRGSREAVEVFGDDAGVQLLRDALTF